METKSLTNLTSLYAREVCVISMQRELLDNGVLFVVDCKVNL